MIACATLFSEQFTLNDNGTRASAQESQLQPDGSTVNASTSWEYDEDGRLILEAAGFTDSADPADAPQSYSNSYSYGLSSNRPYSLHVVPRHPTERETVTYTYTYNGDGELISQTSSLSGTTTNTYDANGSLTSSTVGGVTTTYTYDARNKMVGYSSGTTTASYVYDDAGNRVEETVGSVATYYLTDTQNPTGYAQPLEQKSSPSATPSLTCFLGDRVIAQADGSGNVTYLMPDGHGSTEQLTNGTGAVTKALQYDSFGDALNFTPGAVGTDSLAALVHNDGCYIVDNNLSPKVSEGLRDAGYDAIHVQELYGTPYVDPGDPTIFADAEELGANVITANAWEFPGIAIEVPGELSAAGELKYVLWMLEQLG